MEIASSGIVFAGTLYLTDKSSICASWEITDNETSISNYHFSLCLERDKYNCPISARDLNNRTFICVEEPVITEGQSYVIRITATNQVGLSSTADSPKLIVDTTEPDIGEITASNPLGKEYRLVSSAIFASWNGFVDLETGIRGYTVCIGTEPALCDITTLVSVGNATSYTWYNLSLVHDEEYFVSIKCLNNADVSTNFTASQPIAVDNTGKLRENFINSGFSVTRLFKHVSLLLLQSIKQSSFASAPVYNSRCIYLVHLPFRIGVI